MKETSQGQKFVICGLAVLLILLSAGTSLAGSVRMAVKANIANLRNGPGTQYQVLWQVEKYHPLMAVKFKDHWAEVKDFEGDTAWVHDSLLDKTQTVITSKDECNVRAEPTTTSRIVLKVERGVPFKVEKQKGDWFRIVHADGESGWIHKTLVW